MADVPTHHMIYGTMADYLTGEPLVDTDDERYRQALARLLVEERGFAKNEVIPRLSIETLFAKTFVVSKIDLTVALEGKKVFIVRYGPGSLVTRERPAVAAARVLERDYVIPYAVVTNGRDAELLDSVTGAVLGRGMEAIPSRGLAMEWRHGAAFPALTDPARRERELRVLNAFDLEICCAGGPCALPGAKEG